jgi:ribosomal-protein-alanine N-acetyltransferase
MDLQLRRLSEIDPAEIIELMNHRLVRRHMPLAEGEFGAAQCAAFVAGKEALWRDHGYGPWAFLVGGEFAGWGGLQPEDDGEADLALVLHPRFWGHGRRIYERILDHAFDTLGFDSVVVFLPPTRGGAHGIVRLGFRLDGETTIWGKRFLRYRLLAAARQ